MLLPNHYAYGMLFAFSGLDGPNSHAEDFAAVTMPDEVTLRFDAPEPVTLQISVPGETPDFLLPDAMRFPSLSLVFADAACVLGETEREVRIFGGKGRPKEKNGARFLRSGGFFYALKREGTRFVFCREKSEKAAFEACERKLSLDLAALTDARLGYFRDLPRCPRPAYERLWYKCLAVQKVNVYSPGEGFPCRYTTPDRLPHRHVWLWDSMFHALSYARYDPETAKDAVNAVLACQKKDGFLPHMMKSPTDVSSVTQPTVVAWVIEEIYNHTGDRAFLEKTAPVAAAFLRWFMKNRDKNGNGLPEWHTDFLNVRCRCDESGMDNSPRFDVPEPLDAIDAACFLAHDAKCLSRVFTVLGDEKEAAFFRGVFEALGEKINETLWDEALGAYCDRGFSGKLTGVLTVSSFLPLFAGVAPPERAERLAKLIEDPAFFGTPLPLPSVAKNHPDYGKDMWRGGVWINYNYMIAEGLRESGFAALAEELKEKTLREVERVFEATGNIFEFYDPECKTEPWRLPRKGPQPEVPDYRVKYHAITDYHWTAAFLLLWLSEG